MNTRLAIVKTVLWGLIGVLAALTVARFARGLGAATALTDATPWGFWIAFDVMSGVALAAGGFVMAATVYIFGGQKYRPFVRPAILTALLGYIAVAVGLLYDLGLPWHIWHPMVYPQHHSVLFEVAMCVMLYLAVLSLEFAPVVLEHGWFDRPLFRRIRKLLHMAVIPLVIAGIMLSTLHQSSLGSLFLITPYRLHPLWYSPIIWILFLVSAVALGLMMVTAESFFSAWLFGHKPQTARLAGLGRAASMVLFLYAALRLADLAARGLIPTAFDGSWQAWLFLSELAVSALIPATLLSFRRVRNSTPGLAVCAGLTIVGIIGNRFDVCIVAFSRPAGMSYFPNWMELAVSLGIVAVATLVFLFFVERLRVAADEHSPGSEKAPGGFAESGYSPAGVRSLMPDSFGAPRRYSLAVVVGAAVTVAFLPASLLSGRQLLTTPVSATRTLDGLITGRDDGKGHDISLAEPGAEKPPGASEIVLLSIDGNRDGQLVLFPHAMHIGELGDRDSCHICHHQNMPFDKNSACCECHRDMYTVSDTFDHAFHVDKLDGNEGCARCHQDPAEIKSRDTATACIECHQDMIVADSMVAQPQSGLDGFAVGYMDAMHGLCIRCHEQELDQSRNASFAQCANCHRDIDGSRFRQMKPYLASEKGRK